MTINRKWHTGVCSWSLGNDIDQLKLLKDMTGISHIHLHIRPELGKVNEKFISDILSQGWTISCGMINFQQEDYSTLESIAKTGGIVPAENWIENYDKVRKAIDILSELRVRYLSFHFGFIDNADDSLIEKVILLADYALERNIMLLMETGQETADRLDEFLRQLNHPAIGVNFDPANMILYGKGKPAEAIKQLAPWIKHIHIKDAVPPTKAGNWGAEVPWSNGEVGGDVFLDKLEQAGYEGSLCVERECGVRRFEDVSDAISKIDNFIKKHIDNETNI